MYRIVALMLFVIVGMLIGCQNGKSAKAKSDVLNVAAAPAPIPEPAPAPTVAPQPVYDAQPVSYAANAPAPSATGSKTYTVKKGDTLFSIAKASYGTGRDWQKIVSANPGLDPQKLKPGQTLTIP